MNNQVNLASEINLEQTKLEFQHKYAKLLSI